MRTSVLVSLLLCSVLLAAATPSVAGRFDIIYGDRLRLDSGPWGGINTSFGFIVNTGDEPLTADELFNASFQVVASEPDFLATPFINNPGQPPVAPILPGEAVGAMPFQPELFLSLIEPSETLREIDAQFFAIQVERQNTLYEGTVTFDVMMLMAGEQVAFTITGTFIVGDEVHDGDFAYLSAARVSSASIPTATQQGTWGALKALYK